MTALDSSRALQVFLDNQEASSTARQCAGHDGHSRMIRTSRDLIVRPGHNARAGGFHLDPVFRQLPDRGMVRVQALTINQDGETVQSFTPRLVVPRRPV